MRAWFVPPRRATEASPEQLVATGAMPGGPDPVDGDRGWRLAGSAGRPVPEWTLEKTRAHSVAAYRMNPMGRGAIDTIVSFCVGDSGARLIATNDDVQAVAEEFWNDPRNDLGNRQEILLRDTLIMGEQALELLVGEQGRRVRIRPLDPTQIDDVTIEAGNPLWPRELVFRPAAVGGEELRLPVVQTSDSSGLREGKVMFLAPWRTLLSDRRGLPYLTPVLDWLDAHDQVTSNLIDRTALARHVVFTVKVNGDQDDVNEYVASRGGLHVPPSGSVEVHNEDVEWGTINAQTGAYEDRTTASGVMTLIAGGAGLAKTWLAEPDGANRATSLTMAEPVRRRVGGIQRMWLAWMTDLVRFAVDQAVLAGRLPKTVDATDSRTGRTIKVPASQCVQVIGPQIAAADADLQAQVLLNLSTGLGQLVESQAITTRAARAAARVAWESYTGITWTPDLDEEDPGVIPVVKPPAEGAPAQGGAARLRPVPATKKPPASTEGTG